MNKLKIYLLLFITLCYSCADNAQEPEELYLGRTIFFYLVGDNNIYHALYNNIPALVEGMADYGERCRALIYWDGPDEDPVLFKYEISEWGELSKRTILRTYAEQNSVDPEIMTMILEDMFSVSSSSSGYGLVLGSHALSWVPPTTKNYSRSFGDDAGQSIAIPEMAQAIEAAIYQPFDFILFDACLMSSVEVVYEMKHLADYIIASPTEILNPGFPYHKIMRYMFSNKVSDYTTKVAEEFIYYYENEYKTKWGNVAVIKCDEMEGLAKETYNIMASNVDKLDNFNIKDMQRYDRDNKSTTHFAFDFDQFIRKISSEEEYEKFKIQFDKTVIYKDVIIYPAHALLVINEENYSGIGGYIMQKNKSEMNEYYKTLAWYKASGWSQTSWGK